LISELLSGSKLLSQYSRTSSTPVWALLPTEKTLEKRIPLGIADSKIKTAVAPDPETRSQPLSLSLGTGDVKIPLYEGVITPIQLGPIRHPPDSSIINAISCSSFFPSSPDSANPADIIIKAFVPFSLIRLSTTVRQYFAEIARIARSAEGTS